MTTLSKLSILIALLFSLPSLCPAQQAGGTVIGIVEDTSGPGERDSVSGFLNVPQQPPPWHAGPHHRTQ